MTDDQDLETEFGIDGAERMRNRLAHIEMTAENKKVFPSYQEQLRTFSVAVKMIGIPADFCCQWHFHVQQPHARRVQ